MMLLQRVSSLVVLTLGLVATVLVFRSSSSMEAAGQESKQVSFRTTITGSETRILGRVPEGRTLLLKDFYSVDGQTEFYELLADGEVVLPLQIGDFGGNLTNRTFSAGIAIPSGKELALHCLDRTSAVTTDVFVAGILR